MKGAMNWVRSLILRSVMFALGWFAVTEADSGVAIYGLIAVPLATGASLLLSSGPSTKTPRPRQLVAAISLSWWVLGRSIVGGLDVARRALHPPRPDIEPYWSSYNTSLPTEVGRVTFALVLNLMPGTLSTNLDGDRFDLHVISRDVNVMASLIDLERRVEAICHP